MGGAGGADEAGTTVRMSLPMRQEVPA